MQTLTLPTCTHELSSVDEVPMWPYQYISIHHHHTLLLQYEMQIAFIMIPITVQCKFHTRQKIWNVHIIDFNKGNSGKRENGHPCKEGQYKELFKGVIFL